MSWQVREQTESEGGDALRWTACKEYCIPLEYNLYNTNMHTWQHVINIASCSGSHHGSVYQLLSLEQHMCGRYSRGKAPRLTTLLIKTCQPAFVCAGRCSCVLSVWSGMLFLVSARVCIWLMCMFQAHMAQVRAGKDAVYEIGVIYLTCGGGWWRLPGASTAGNIQMRERSLWFVVEGSRCEAIYNWGIPIRSCPA